MSFEVEFFQQIAIYEPTLGKRCPRIEQLHTRVRHTSSKAYAPANFTGYIYWFQ